jgi:hypothetical protein
MELAYLAARAAEHARATVLTVLIAEVSSRAKHESMEACTLYKMSECAAELKAFIIVGLEVNETNIARMHRCYVYHESILKCKIWGHRIL